MDKLRDLDLRLRLLVAVSVIVAAAAVVLILQTSSNAGSSTAQDDGASNVLGLGRSTVHMTAGSAMQARLGVPRGTSVSDVHWKLEGSDIAKSGSGDEVSFTAPDSGFVTLTVHAEHEGRKLTSRTKLDVMKVEDLAGSDLKYHGTVMIDGGRAVSGEAFTSGTKVDAERGDVSYVARAAIDGSLRGRLTYSGTMFTVTAEERGTRVMNGVEVGRTTTGSRKLHVEAEHLDGTRYVKVTTPDSVAMVKGTGFDITVSGTSSSVSVVHGVVYAVDRFRYYVASRDLTAGQRMDVAAVDVALAAADAGAVLQPGGAALQSSQLDAASHDDVHESEALGARDDVIDAVIEATENEVPAPVVHDTPDDGSEDGSGDGSDGQLVNDPGDDGGDGTSQTDPADPGTGSDGSGGSNGTPYPDPGTGSGGQDTTGTTGGGTTDGGSTGGGSTGGGGGSTGGGSTGGETAPEAPPTTSAYKLEDFLEWSRRCRTSHVLWNGNYGDGGTSHRCVPRTRFASLIKPGMGYQPPAEWGCYRLHGIWRATTDPWCWQTSQSGVDMLGNYEVPRGMTAGGDDVQMPCSTGHVREDASGRTYCRRTA